MITPCEAVCADVEDALPELPSGKRIMVVEDDPGLLALYRILLHTRGYRVLTAEDGEEALLAFTRERSDIDLLIADVCLPKLGAVEMLERMKSVGMLPPVLVCSGAVEYDVELELRKIGATWFLPKPFRNRDMLGEIERILGEDTTGRN